MKKNVANENIIFTTKDFMPKISYNAIRRKVGDNQSEKFVALVQGEIIRNISDATIYTLHSIISAFQSYTPHTTTCFNSKKQVTFRVK